MSANKASSKNSRGKKWPIIGYSLAAMLAVVGFILVILSNSVAKKIDPESGMF